ncbi:MAG: PQQ-binding-like beta-propeller repeat protein [Fuerstiella sp.]|nr:PQQ-binding-like beta-propeller repeat protein [Fuerstiella sp.]MCP4784909.1 PQQ-binding-like beta-propeller repeat protein [Fuerstiella sp.]MCP4859360.1 PQQ-binding-like beta-propeller repeat protein [Fuerstiella sp.]
MRHQPATTNRHRAILALAGLVGTFFLSPAHSGDWRQFRGNAANSIAQGENLPTELSGGSIAWKVELPGRGLSGPIAVGQQILLTASSGYSQDRLHILSIDAETGETQWERQFEATGRTGCHPKMCIATPTPASDGERIFAFYSSSDLICTDLAGNLQWYRGFGAEYRNASNSLGMSSSPIVIGSTVIIQAESEAEAFAAGVDTLTGETKWKIDRPRKANWTSPTILPATNGKPALALLQSSAGLSAVDPETGDVVWTFDNGASTIPSSLVVDGTVVIPSNGLTSVRPSADGTKIESIWNSSNLGPSTPSPVVINGLTITVNSAGALSAGDVTTGERLWQLRLKGKFSSTPLASNGHLFFFNETGYAFVVRPEREKGEIVSELDLAETILCSPAASDNALYVRSDGHLWKFAEQR